MNYHALYYSKILLQLTKVYPQQDLLVYSATFDLFFCSILVGIQMQATLPVSIFLFLPVLIEMVSILLVFPPLLLQKKSRGKVFIQLKGPSSFIGGLLPEGLLLALLLLILQNSHFEL
jgi:hypothetical protein